MIAQHRTDGYPVTDRLVVLQFVRLLVIAALLIVPAIAGTGIAAAGAIALGYAAFTGVVEVAHRRYGERSVPFVSWTVLVDGLAVASAVAVTGGYRSPLLFLVFLLVMAVTLVASYRTGLWLAVWCALLLLLAHAAADAGMVQEHAIVDDRLAGVSAATFLLFAFCTAFFSRVNERSLRHSRAQLESLVELGAELERAQRHDEAMAALVHHACGRLGFLRAVVLIRRGAQWTGVVDDGVVEARIETREHDTPLVRDCWASGAPVLVRVVDDDLLDLVLPSARNAVVAPVAADGDDLGVFVGEWGGGSDARIPLATVQSVAQAAMHTALALRNAELLGEVERLATRDSLTGLANRRLFDEALHREAARAVRLAMPLGLVVLDVDHFKQVNDTYGHQTGDNVLREVADALVANTKAFDVPARYGGDEFVVLLPNCSLADAVGVAERVRGEIVQHVGDVPVTVSAGVAALPENAGDAGRLLAAADTALYEAKRLGRDRVAASARRPESSRERDELRFKPPLARGA